MRGRIGGDEGENKGGIGVKMKGWIEEESEGKNDENEGKHTDGENKGENGRMKARMGE